MNQLASSGGDTCLVHAGTYTSTGPDRFGPTITRGGASGNPNTLAAFGDGEVVLTSDDGDARDTMRVGASNLKITGITFRNRMRIQTSDNLELTGIRFVCPGGNDNGTPDWSNYSSIFSESTGTSSSSKHDNLWIHDNLFLYDSSCTSQGSGMTLVLSFTHLYSTNAAIIENNDFRVTAGVTSPEGRIQAAAGLKECNQNAKVRFNYFEATADEISEPLWDLNNSADYGCVSNGENLWYQNIIRANGATIGTAMVGSGNEHSDAHFYNNTVIGASTCIQGSQDGAGTIRRDEVFNIICYNTTSKHV
jgi:hypothetical protein